MMSSLFTGATGMRAFGEGMSVVGNNLANVNTIGFKQSMALYQDLVSSFVTADSNTMTNISQKGMGSAIGINRTLFTQGSFQPGSANTDVAIQGKGFFGVSKDGKTEYTRAGNFRFTNEGELVDPSGWTVLGRTIDKNGNEAGSASPVKLDFTNGTGGIGYTPGQASSWVQSVSQLGGLQDKAQKPGNPYFAMAASWNGTSNPPLGVGQFSYSEPVEFYDAAGNRQKATIYYDRADTVNGMNIVEYMIAMDPALDGSSRAGTESAGLLMAGTITFDSAGTMQGLSGFTPPAGGSPANLAAWAPAGVKNGMPVFSPNITGAGVQSVGMDFGLRLPGDASQGLASAADAATNASKLATPINGATREQMATTAWGSSPASRSQNTDGFGEGYLRDVTIGEDGVVKGVYSNNQTLELARLVLYRFTSQDGLRKEGGNHFAATEDSGAAQEGIPGTENFGKLAQRSIEQSNVDYAREFTHMIITQRGFQMNSKVVTTSDQMIQKALELKR